MNPLQRALIEKGGNDNGFEYVLASEQSGVMLASARHLTRVMIVLENGAYQAHFQAASPTLLLELQRSFPQQGVESGRFTFDTETALAVLLRRAASLSRALPDQAATDYQHAVTAELAEFSAGIIGTEVERLVRQRVGQNKFRSAMLDYWGNACAVTGITIPAVLRASHTKPWVECASDAERLDVFNGFLLSSNLDALFDSFLISFDENGRLIIAPALIGKDLLLLGIVAEMKLRWVTPKHQSYLVMHRARLLKKDYLKS
ncbi:HNH endonuclease [Undibacterium sp. Ji49W]|uniref:HNH endonuclease n=1 Tax=Undibacterium sp. Ji49W TaxID=3413040 RepID=UPI003BF3D729